MISPEAVELPNGAQSIHRILRDNKMVAVLNPKLVVVYSTMDKTKPNVLSVLFTTPISSSLISDNSPLAL